MRQPICYVGQEVFCAPHEGAEKTLLSAGSVSRMCQLFFLLHFLKVLKPMNIEMTNK